MKGPELGRFWKYRVGDYRLICHIEGQRVTILVVRYPSGLSFSLASNQSTASGSDGAGKSASRVEALQSDSRSTLDILRGRPASISLPRSPIRKLRR